MSWTNRIIWQEGMFLRAQHFQQQDRWLEALVRERTAALRPYGWGMINLALNRDLLATGRFALSSGAGVFEDGTPFSLPGDTDLPEPLDLPETTRDQIVFLALPIRQAGAQEIAAEGNSDGRQEGRYGQAGFEAYDTHSGSPQPADLRIGRLRLRYMLESENRAGYYGIGLARVREIGADRRVTLDEGWMAPALICAAVPSLAGLLTEFSGILNQRGEELALRITAPASRTVADVEDFLLLQSINRAQKLLSHWADAGQVHPADVYAALVQIAGDLATFGETRRPSSYPPYRHFDLQRSFAPVVADIRGALAEVDDPTAIQIPLEDRRYNMRIGTITDRSLLSSSNFVLVVQADMPSELLRRLFPAKAKIGANNQIANLVNVALPGIAIRPMPVAPRQLRPYPGATYFELDRNSPHWQHMASAAGFGLHVPNEDFPNVKLELWAIRG